MRPTLLLSDCDSYSTSSHDTWDAVDSPSSTHAATVTSARLSSTSSSTSSSSSHSQSHVLPESAFSIDTRNADGTTTAKYLVDPYFGQEEPARLCSSYLVRSFRCNEETDKSRALRQPKLPIFIAQLIHITGAPFKLVMAALILLKRFRDRIPETAGSATQSFSGHSLFMGALMLACTDKHLWSMTMVGDAGSAAYWSRISRFSESELDEIFNALYDELDGNIVVFPSYAAALEKLNNPVHIKSFDAELDFFSSSLSAGSTCSSIGQLSHVAHDAKSVKKPAALSPPKNGFEKRAASSSGSVRTMITSLFSRKPKV